MRVTWVVGLLCACGSNADDSCDLGDLLGDPSACSGNTCDFGHVVDDHVGGADVTSCGRVVNDGGDEDPTAFDAARACALAADLDRRPFVVEYLEKSPEPYGLGFVGLFDAEGVWQLTQISGALATSTTRYFCTRLEHREGCLSSVDRLCLQCQAPARRDTCVIESAQ